MRANRIAFLVAGAFAVASLWAQKMPRSGDEPVVSVRTAYLALVRDSIVPAEPRTVAAAALKEMASSERATIPALPVWFGSDATRDADWISERASHLVPPWAVINAMARAAATPHVGLSTPEIRRGMRALAAGRPLSSLGFGVHRVADGRTVVIDVVQGGSADLSGLHAGDVLTRIGRETIARQASPLMPLVARAAHEELTLGIERDGKSMDIALRFIDADLRSVESRLLGDGVAYVRIRWFSRSEDPERDTAALARAALQSLAAQGARGLVLDLRSAIGGIGDVAVASAMADGDVVYYVQQPLTASPEPVRRQGTRVWPDRPIVLLVNEQTISAGEALALSVRELAHCTIVGQTTAGGLTEFSAVDLGSDHVLIVPTGLVLGPVTRSDQPGHAVRPDLVVPNASIDDLLHRRDRQLEAARGVLARANDR